MYLLKLYIKYKDIDLHPIKPGMLTFCNGYAGCASCKIIVECTNFSNSDIPKVSTEDVHKLKIEHPEYFI